MIDAPTICPECDQSFEGEHGVGEESFTGPTTGESYTMSVIRCPNMTPGTFKLLPPWGTTTA